MGIDWFTFGAQLLNLAVLVALLYKFLYKPLLNAIDAREEKISNEIKHAEDLKLEAEHRLTELNQKHADFEAQRQKALEQAHRVADELKARLEREVRDDAMETRKTWKQELDQERKSLETQMRDDVVKNFALLARKALKDLADSTLETQMIAMLNHRIYELPEEEKKRLTPDVNSPAVVSIYTTKELSQTTQNDLTALVFDALTLGSETPLVFEINKHLLCGIEISVNGNVLSWNLDAYVQTFTENMNKTLTEVSLRLAREEN